jgi:hypothetical protein
LCPPPMTIASYFPESFEPMVPRASCQRPIVRNTAHTGDSGASRFARRASF